VEEQQHSCTSLCKVRPSHSLWAWHSSLDALELMQSVMDSTGT